MISRLMQIKEFGKKGKKVMAEFPTKRQEDTAKIIAKTLKRPLPSVKTKQTYEKFIKDNINAFKRERQKYVTDYDYGLGAI